MDEGREKVERREREKVRGKGKEGNERANEGKEGKERVNVGKERKERANEGKQGKERVNESPSRCFLFFLPDGSKNCSVSVKQFFVCLLSATETPDILLEVVTRRKGQTNTSAVDTFTHPHYPVIH